MSSPSPCSTMKTTLDMMENMMKAKPFVRLSSFLIHHSLISRAGQLVLLLFWDIIFIPLPYAFQHCSQRQPIDFGTRAFYQARQPYFQYFFHHLQTLSDDELERFVERSVQYHSGLASSIEWELVDVEWLKRVAVGLGGSRIASLAEHLCMQ